MSLNLACARLNLLAPLNRSQGLNLPARLNLDLNLALNLKPKFKAKFKLNPQI